MAQAGNEIDVREVFTLLESRENRVIEEITTLIQGHLASSEWILLLNTMHN